MTDFSNEYILSKIMANDLEWFFLALNESIIVTDPFKLLFIQGIDAEFEVTEKLPSVVSPEQSQKRLVSKKFKRKQFSTTWGGIC